MGDLRELIAERLGRREQERRLEAIETARRKQEAFEQVRRNFMQLQHDRTAIAEAEFARRMKAALIVLSMPPTEVFEAMIHEDKARALIERIRREVDAP